MFSGEINPRPDRQMVARTARLQAVVDAATADVQRLVDHNPIEPGDGSARVKTRRRRRDAEMMGEIAQTSAVKCPFVKVTHQDGW